MLFWNLKFAVDLMWEGGRYLIIIFSFQLIKTQSYSFPGHYKNRFQTKSVEKNLFYSIM